SVSRLPGVPAGYRAAQLPDVGVSLPNGFFEVFGRPPRESACECERTSGMMLGPVMTLVNGPTIAEAIGNPDNEIARLVAHEADDAKVVDELFLRILSRPATPGEIRAGIEALHASAGEAGVLQGELAKYEATLDSRQAAWEARQVAPVWTNLEPVDLQSSIKATFAKQPDQSVLVEGANGKGTYTITLNTDLSTITAVRLEVLADPKLPGGGPGRAGNGNLVLAELKATLAPKADPSKAAPVAFARASADFSQALFQIGNAIDGNPQSGWAIVPQTGKDHSALFEIKDPLKIDGGITLVVTLDHQYDDVHTVGKFRLAVTASPQPLNMPSLPANIAEILAIAPDSRSAEQKSALAAHYRTLDGEWVRLRAAVTSAEGQQKNIRLTGAQDLAWALINSPAFLFNR
ncbi:MAG: hypothetical protein WDZ48_01770, partial [Pirellulales bacterium]